VPSPPIAQETRCKCFYTQGECLKKYDCYNGAPYYVFHYSCLGDGCAETHCGSASSLVISTLTLALATLLATL
jgi:hypothetical protein